MAQEPKPGDQPHPDQQRPAPTPPPTPQPKTDEATTKPVPKDVGPDDEVMAIRKAAGSIAEVIDNPQMQPQRVRIG